MRTTSTWRVRARRSARPRTPAASAMPSLTTPALAAPAGACDGSLACSTCHVVLEPAHFDALPPPDEEEEDMLDLAFGLTDTSRLGCQIKLQPSHAGMVLKIPGM